MLESLSDLLTTVNDFFYGSLLIFLLVGAGLWFTVRTWAVQIRHFPKMISAALSSRDNDHGISSFQAFAIGLASRIGTGNVAGVAIALALGGPGAIFWMWVVAFFGMATAFVEATLAQVFKVRWHDGTFRGGPAFYMQRALGWRPMGIAFAIFLIFAFGIAFNMVQANTISETLSTSHGVPSWVTALVLFAITAPILFGGIRRVARITEWLAPLMALAYVILAVVIIVTNLSEVPAAIGMIFRGAFGLDEALAGTAGGMLAALLNGARRGLFSNEAGMGSAPNAAATSTVKHPVQQGYLQSLGVFVDTMLVCTATATIILLSSPEVYTPGVTADAAGAALTQTAVADSLGAWTTIPMTIIIFVLAYSSVLGNYTYAEVNTDFLSGTRTSTIVLRCLVIASVIIGALAKLGLVWSIADVAMGLMATTNLIALFLVGKWAIGALKDYERSIRAGDDNPGFLGKGNPLLPGDVPGDVWTQPDGVPYAHEGEKLTPKQLREG